MTGNLPYRNLIFIPVFFAFYLVFKTFGVNDLILTHFNGRPLSIATAEGIDIAARVSLFYKGVLFLIFLLIALTRLTVIVQRFIPAEEIRLLNGLSLAGFCLLFFRLLGADVRPTLHVIFALLGIIAVGSVFHQVRKRSETNYTVAFLWSSMLGVSTFFLQWQLIRLTGSAKFLSLPLTLLISGSVFYLLSTNTFSINYRILKATFPLIFIPLLSFVSMEGTMILNQRGIFISQAPLYFAGLFFILGYTFFAYKKYKGMHSGISHLTIFFTSWIPWAMAGMLCLAFYSPIVNADVDMFESANNILPLHQWFNFGRVPLIDTFNAHTAADFSTGWVYSFFNGLNPMGYFVYRFLVHVIVLLLIYFMIYKMTGDGFLALWLTLVYPYADHLIPSYFNLVPVCIIAFIRLYEKQTVSRYMMYFGSLLLMVLWRIDLGMSVLIAGGFSFLMLAFLVPSFSVNRRNLYRGFLFTSSILFVLFLMALFHSGAHLFVTIKDILGYLSSIQSYGVKDLASGIDIQYYSLYFILPSVILLIIAATIYNIRSGNISGNSVITGLVIIFLGIFYFSNFQRGLVRHTLFEQWNMALTSYGFFIIAAYVFMLIHKHAVESRFFIFFIVSTLLIANYVYREPDLKTNNSYYSLAQNIYASPFPVTNKEKINRIVEEPSIKQNYSHLKNWLDAKFPKSTFVDFSNTPMLYYYTNRIVPSYFLQIPHTAHSDYLQKRFIEDLANYDVPIAVFSNVPNNFWDYLDGIPNTLRHYKIAEYLYREYKPAQIIDGHSLWIRKSVPNSQENELYSIKGDSFMVSGFADKSDQFVVDGLRHWVNESQPFEGKRYATLSFKSKQEGEMILYYNAVSFEDKRQCKLHFFSGENNLFVMLDKLNDNEKLTDIRISLNPPVKIAFSEVKIFGAENYFDHFSTQPVSSSLKWIPYIWGKYDADYQAGKIELEQKILSESQTAKQYVPLRIEFVPIKSKENGNYLKLVMKNTSDKVQEVTVRYGAGERTNGSFSFTLFNDTEFHDYLLRISSQYGWYNNDNTWISVTPSVDTEVKSAEILKGD